MSEERKQQERTQLSALHASLTGETRRQELGAPQGAVVSKDCIREHFDPTLHCAKGPRAYVGQKIELNFDWKARAESAESALEKIAALWLPKHEGALKRHENSGTEAFEDGDWQEANTLSSVIALIPSTIRAMSDPLKPQAALLCKIGSIVGHAEEGLSAEGHEFDRIALKTLIADPDVQAWMAAMRSMAMVPQPRNNPKKGARL